MCSLSSFPPNLWIIPPNHSQIIPWRKRSHHPFCIAVQFLIRFRKSCPKTTLSEPFQEFSTASPSGKPPDFPCPAIQFPKSPRFPVIPPNDRKPFYFRKSNSWFILYMPPGNHPPEQFPMYFFFRFPPALNHPPESFRAIQRKFFTYTDIFAGFPWIMHRENLFFNFFMSTAVCTAFCSFIKLIRWFFADSASEIKFFLFFYEPYREAANVSVFIILIRCFSADSASWMKIFRFFMSTPAQTVFLYVLSQNLFGEIYRIMQMKWKNQKNNSASGRTPHRDSSESNAAIRSQ